MTMSETKTPYLQGYSDALDGRINLIAYDQHADYHSGYNQALQDTQQLEKTDDTTF
jgi:arginase family enzyme